MSRTKNTAAVADPAIAPPEPDDQGTFGIYNLTEIRISKTNRKRFNQQALQELADNIKQIGVAQPILIRPVFAPTDAEPQKYEIVAGERRWRASIIAGVSTIPAMLRVLTDLQAAKIQILENLQRENPHPLEEAEGYENLMLAHGYSADQLVDELKKSRSYIYGRLKLCSLAKDIRDDFLDDKFSASTALLIARIPVPALQIKVVKEITAPQYGGEPMSYRQAASHIQNRYMLQLGKAPFDIKDTKLLAVAGNCIKCPKRSGNQPEVFADIDQNICTDPDCFSEKKAALDVRKIADANKKGIPLFEGADATEKTKQRHMYIAGDDYLWSLQRFKEGANRNQFVETALPTSSLPKPECLIRASNGKIRTLYLREDIQAALEKDGICMTEQENDQRHAEIVNMPPTEKQLAERAEQEADRKAAEDETKFRLALYKQIRQRGTNAFDIRSQRELLNLALTIILEDSSTDCRPLSDLYKFGCDRHSAISNHIEQASTDELQRVLMDFLITDHLEIDDVSDVGEDYDHFKFILKIAEHEGIDVEAVRKSATQPPEVIDATPFKRPLLTLKKKTPSPTVAWPFPTPNKETAGVA